MKNNLIANKILILVIIIMFFLINFIYLFAQTDPHGFDTYNYDYLETQWNLEGIGGNAGSNNTTGGNTGGNTSGGTQGTMTTGGSTGGGTGAGGNIGSNTNFKAWIPIWEGTSCSKNNAPVGACNFCDALIVIKNIIENGFRMGVVVAIIMFAYGSIVLGLAGGSENNIKKGKTIVINALIGLLLVLLSWTIINLLLHLLTGKPDLPWHSLKCNI